MARFRMVAAQAVSLCGANSWSINSRNMSKLRSFHNIAVRHMTSNHIVKKNDVWEHPNHEKLCKKKKSLPANICVERRRGTLRKCLELNRKDLLTKALSIKKHCYDVSKALW